jgi:nucleoid-associated protein YgaU
MSEFRWKPAYEIAMNAPTDHVDPNGNAEPDEQEPAASFPSVDYGKPAAPETAVEEPVPAAAASLPDAEQTAAPVVEADAEKEDTGEDGDGTDDEGEDAPAGSRGLVGAVLHGASTLSSEGFQLARRYPRAALASGLSLAILGGVLVLKPGFPSRAEDDKDDGKKANASAPDTSTTPRVPPTLALTSNEPTGQGNDGKPVTPPTADPIEPPPLPTNGETLAGGPESAAVPPVEEPKAGDEQPPAPAPSPMPTAGLLASNEPPKDPMTLPDPAPAPATTGAEPGALPAAEPVKLTGGEPVKLTGGEQPPALPDLSPDPAAIGPAPSPSLELASAETRPGTHPGEAATPAPSAEPPTQAPASPAAEGTPAVPPPVAVPLPEHPSGLSTTAAAEPAPSVAPPATPEKLPGDSTPAPAPVASAPMPPLTIGEVPPGSPLDGKPEEKKADEQKPKDKKAEDKKPEGREAEGPKPEEKKIEAQPGQPVLPPPAAGIAAEGVAAGAEAAALAGKAAPGSAGVAAAAGGAGLTVGMGLGAALNALTRGVKDRTENEPKKESPAEPPSMEEAPKPATPESAGPTPEHEPKPGPGPSPAADPDPPASTLPEPAAAPGTGDLLPKLRPAGEPIPRAPKQETDPVESQPPAEPGAGLPVPQRDRSLSQPAEEPAPSPSMSEEPPGPEALQEKLSKQGWVPIKRISGEPVHDLQREMSGMGNDAGFGDDGRGTIDPNGHAGKPRSFEAVPLVIGGGGAANSGPGNSGPGAARSEVKLDTVLHRVERGENFWTISRLYYNSGRYYKALWKANSARVPVIDRLVVGTVIRIPPPEELDPAEIEPSGGRERVASREPAEPSRDVADDGDRNVPMAAARRPRPSRAASADEGVPVKRSSRSELELNLPVSDISLDETETRDGRAARDSRASTPPRARDDWQDDEDDGGRTQAYRSRYTVTRPIHKVRPHETLRTIARDALGNARRADEILELNRDLIDDPGHLIVGQVLELPEDARAVRARGR